MNLYKILKRHKPLYPELATHYEIFINREVDKEKIFEKVALEYLDKSKRELLVIELKLKDAINEIERTSMISIGISIIIIVINSLLGDLKELTRGSYIGALILLVPFVLAIWIFLSIGSQIEQYKYYKFCLNIINYIEEDKIELGYCLKDNHTVKYVKVK